MRRPLVLTVVPLLALAGALAWATLHVRQVEARGEPQLHARAVAWERSLTRPSTDSPLEFILPAERSSPRLRDWLLSVARLFAGPQSPQMLQAKVTGPAQGVTTFVVDAGDYGTGHVEFRWARAADGVWYVVPRFKEDPG